MYICTDYVGQEHSVLQCVAVCCSMLQCVAVCCSVLQYVAMCCNVLQYVYTDNVGQEHRLLWG